MRQRRPVAFQRAGGKRRAVHSRYELLGGGLVGIRLGDYDRTRPLVIDPVLLYSTYLGGSGNDRGQGIAVDAAGSAYVTGSSRSTNFPRQNAIQSTHGGNEDVFVSKLDPSGTTLLYSTYLGGGGGDIGHGIAVDDSGNAYVTGYTGSGTFPTANAIQTTLSGPTDAFAAKLNPAGSALVYSTFLGGTWGEQGLGLALDGGRNVYLTGFTDSATTFPTANAIQNTNGGGNDAFVTKINGAGSALVYSTYLGGTVNDAGVAMRWTAPTTRTRSGRRDPRTSPPRMRFRTPTAG